MTFLVLLMKLFCKTFIQLLDPMKGSSLNGKEILGKKINGF